MDSTNGNPNRQMSHWRVVAWASVALLLLAPLAAMQFTDQVDWSLRDFVLFGALLGTAAIAIDLLSRKTTNLYYRSGFGIAITSAFLLIWINGAVGIIGSENEPANLIFAGVLLVGLIGAGFVRFQTQGMSRVMLVTALAQTIVAIVVLVGRLGVESSNWPLDIMGVNGIFVVLWLTSAWLFRKAALSAPGQDALQ